MYIILYIYIYYRCEFLRVGDPMSIFNGHMSAGPAASFDLSRMEASKSGCSNAWAANGMNEKNAPDAEKIRCANSLVLLCQ